MRELGGGGPAAGYHRGVGPDVKRPNKQPRRFTLHPCALHWAPCDSLQRLPPTPQLSPPPMACGRISTSCIPSASQDPRGVDIQTPAHGGSRWGAGWLRHWEHNKPPKPVRRGGFVLPL